MTIQNLNEGTISLSSIIPFWDTSAGADRKTTVAGLLALLVSSLASAGLITQYAAPTATGFTVTVSPPTNGNSMFVLVTPLAAYAAGTLVLPLQANCVDGQEILLITTQNVTALAVNGNGSGTVGFPTGLVANGFFRARYDGVLKNWYRVG